MSYTRLDRRTIVAVLGILCLTFLGIYARIEVSGAIATCVLSVAGANAAQAVFSKPKKESRDVSIAD